MAENSQSAILNLPILVLDQILSTASCGDPQKLAILASVCKTFSFPKTFVSVLCITNSVETQKTKKVINFEQIQFRLSSLIHLAPYLTKITSSVEVGPSTLANWSTSVGNQLTALAIPFLRLSHLEILDTMFPVLEELKVTLTSEVLMNKDLWRVFLKVTKLEANIGKNGFEFLTHCFPNLDSLKLRSEKLISVCNFVHPNISVLDLGISVGEYKLDCPNLKRLRLSEIHKCSELYMKAREFRTEVETVTVLGRDLVQMKFEVQKEEYFSTTIPFFSRSHVDMLSEKWGSVQIMLIPAEELVNLSERRRMLHFPDRRVDNLEYHTNYERTFEYDLDLPVQLVSSLSNSLSFKELYFFSGKDKLDEEQMEVFKVRYQRLTISYPHIKFTSPWDF